MSKLQERSIRVPFAAATLALTLTSACASGPTPATTMNPLPNEPIGRGAATLNACVRWKLPLSAHLSHISASRDGARLLVSTSSDHGVEGRLRLLSKTGKVLWSNSLAQPVKAQAIADDASLAAVNTYDGKLAAYDVKSGKRLWEHDHLGKPAVLRKTRRVVVLNDDDSEPKTAFTTYDYRGKLLATVEADAEPLDMDVSADEQLVAVTTTSKAVRIYSLDGKLLVKGPLPGDPISIKVVGGEPVRLYALTTQPQARERQAVSAFVIKKDSGELTQLWTAALDRKYEAIREAGGIVFLYGNTHLGQALAAFNGASGAELWRRSYGNPASYSSLVFADQTSRPIMTVAVDESTPAGVLHLLAVGSDASPVWDAAVRASSGLYSFAYAPAAPAVIAGTGEPGDGLIEYRQITPAKCPR